MVPSIVYSVFTGGGNCYSIYDAGKYTSEVKLIPFLKGKTTKFINMQHTIKRELGVVLCFT